MRNNFRPRALRAAPALRARRPVLGSGSMILRTYPRLITPTGTWTRILVVPIVALGLTLVTGCVPIPVWRSVHYDLAGIELLPQRPSVTLYQFDDVRQVGESRIGVRRGYWHGRRTSSRPAESLIFGPPVGKTVTQAFAEGLKARGFTLVD